MQYSWITLQGSARRFRFTLQVRPVNTGFVQEGIARTLPERIRLTTLSWIATQMFGRDILSKLQSVGRLHRARAIAHVPLRLYRQARQIISPDISMPSSVTSSRRRASQLVNSQRSVYPSSHPSIRRHPASRYLSSKPETGSLVSSV